MGISHYARLVHARSGWRVCADFFEASYCLTKFHARCRRSRSFVISAHVRFNAPRALLVAHTSLGVVLCSHLQRCSMIYHLV